MSEGKVAEFRSKVRKVRRVMKENRLRGIYLKSQANFSWLSGGGENYVGIASTIGSGGLLVSESKVHLIANRIELDRLAEEELRGLPVSGNVFPWENPPQEADIVARILGGGKMGSDCGLDGSEDVTGLIKPLRYSLHPTEIRRYRALARDAEEAMRRTCLSLKPGLTEYEIAGRLAEEAFSRRMQPITLLIAEHGRIRKYRHPIPTGKRCRRTVMVILCARRGGLIVSLTRLVSFRPVGKDLAKRHGAVSRVDATLMLNSRPGAVYGDVFRRMMEAYTAEGFPGEWELHHQGGPTGYEARDFKVTQDCSELIRENQAIAWNPSITGTKSEDTILVRRNGFEVLSQARDWPMVRAETPYGTVERPDILVL